MPKTLAQQVNVRIDRQLKTEGDSVFETLGLSPSQAIRAFYETAAKHRHDTAPLISFLFGDSNKAASTMPSENMKLHAAREGRDAVSNALDDIGLSEQTLRKCALTSDDGLLEEAMYDRMLERRLA